MTFNLARSSGLPHSDLPPRVSHAFGPLVGDHHWGYTASDHLIAAIMFYGGGAARGLEAVLDGIDDVSTWLVPRDIAAGSPLGGVGGTGVPQREGTVASDDAAGAEDATACESGRTGPVECSVQTEPEEEEGAFGLLPALAVPEDGLATVCCFAHNSGLSSYMWEASTQFFGIGVRLLKGPFVALAGRFRAVDELVSWPEAPCAPLGTGRILDDESYEQPFCLRCSGPLIAAMCAPVDGPAHVCSVFVPTSCHRCSPDHYFYGGTLRTTLELRELRMPSAQCRTYLAMGHMKRAHPKKNHHLGMTATFEATPGGMAAREEAFMHFLPRVAQLQNHPARCWPRWHSWPILCRFDWSYPVAEWMGTFGTPWLPDGKDVATKVAVASTSSALQDAAIVENDGVVPARIDHVDPAVARACGITGTLPPPPLPSAGPLCFTPDGRCRLSDAQVAFAVGPVLGTAVVYDPGAHENAISVCCNRIGGQHAEARKFRWAPANAEKKQMRACVEWLCHHVFTKEALLEAALEKGTLDIMLADKMGEETARRMINDLQAGHEVNPAVPILVKREATNTPGKAPRGVMDKGRENFVGTAFVLKLMESVYGHFDASVNIKGRPKSEVLDEISTACSREAVYGPDGLDEAVHPAASARLIESDYSKYEYSQALEFANHDEGVAAKFSAEGKDEADLGLLFVERQLIRHCLRLLPAVLDEIGAQESLVLPGQCMTTFKAKVKECKAAMSRIRWEFLVFLLSRLSGDVQTSWANRAHNMLLMLCSTLARPIDALVRLQLFQHGTLNPKHAKNWCFAMRNGAKRVAYRRFWLEGDDYLAHLVGDKTMLSMAADAPAAVSPTQADVLAALNAFGVDATYYVRHSVRAEFVGAHFLVDSGFTVKGAWAPDVARGLTKGCVGCTEAFRGRTPAERAVIALSFLARAVMFYGRVTPMHNHWLSLSLSWMCDPASPEEVATLLEGGTAGCLAQDSPASAAFQAVGDFMVKADWSMASIVGVECGTSHSVRAIYAMLQLQCGGGIELPAAQQKALAEASLEHPISCHEWGQWMASNTQLGDHADDVLACMPLAVCKRLGVRWNEAAPAPAPPPPPLGADPGPSALPRSGARKRGQRAGKPARPSASPGTAATTEASAKSKPKQKAAARGTPAVAIKSSL